MSERAADWRAVWAEIDRRRIHLGLSWRELERRSNVSIRTFKKMEKDGVPLQSFAKQSTLAAALRWEAFSIEAIASGHPPAPLADDPPAATSPSRPDELAQLVALLQQQVRELIDVTADLAKRVDRLEQAPGGRRDVAP